MNSLKQIIKPLEDKLKEITSEAQELRSGVELPLVDATPMEIIEVMFDLRPRLDRLESLLVQATYLKRDVAQVAQSFITKHEDAWNSYVSNQKNAGAIRGTEYTGPREKYAEADVMTIETLRDKRLAESLVATCETAVTVVRLMHTGIKDLKSDMHVAIRAASFASSVDS